MQQEPLLDVQPFSVVRPQTKLTAVDREPLAGPFTQGIALPDSAVHSDQVRALYALTEAARQ